MGQANGKAEEPSDLERLAGSPQLTDEEQAQAALDEVRKQQEAHAAEMKKEQDRMERLHVSSIVLSGIMQNNEMREGASPSALAKLATNYADALIHHVGEE